MPAIANIISSLETAIRYLLTGATVVVIAVLSRDDYGGFLAWGVFHPQSTLLASAFAGFLAFTVYRMAFWVVGDGIGFIFGWSAPSANFLEELGCRYDKRYAVFLEWRQSVDSKASYNGYLSYRWAAAHYCLLTSICLFAAGCLSSPGSWIKNHDCGVLSTGLGLLILGSAQVFFLFLVERTLFERWKKEEERKKETRSNAASKTLPPIDA